MPTPEFVLKLREKIGHDLLILPGANAVVFDPAGRVLLTLRSDTHQWHVVAGIVEPGEDPSETIRREALEEAGVEIEDLRLLHVEQTPEITFPNGDICRFVSTTYTARAVGGEARVCDEENLAVNFFAMDALPAPLTARSRHIIELAVETLGLIEADTASPDTARG